MHLKPHQYGNFKTPREKRKRDKTPAGKRPGNDPEYLALIRQVPCCACSAPPPSEAHHLKSTGERGVGKRSSDKWALPLCHEHHINGVERVGSRREIQWFKERGIDPLTLASALYQNKHSLEAMLKVLRAHKDTGEPVR